MRTRLFSTRAKAPQAAWPRQGRSAVHIKGTLATVAVAGGLVVAGFAPTLGLQIAGIVAGLLGLLPLVWAQVGSRRDQDVLARRLQWLEDISRVSNDWHWEMDAELRFTYVSPRVEEALGTPPEAWVGHGPKDMVVEGVDDRAALDAHIADLEARRPFREFTFRWFKPDGDEVWISTSGRPRYDAGGSFLGYRGTASDVSARCTAEHAAARTQARLIELTDHVPGVIYQYYRDADGSQGFNFLSGGVRKVFGLEPETVLADPLRMFAFVHSDDRNQVRESLDAAYRDVAPWFLEFRLRIDGQTKWIRCQSQAQDEGDGRVVWNGMLTDITELKETEEALREQQNRYARAVRGSKDGLWDCDVETGSIYYSPRFQELLGFDADTLGNRADTLMHLVHPNDRAELERRIRAHILNDEPYDVEVRMQRGSGDYGWYRLRAETERDATGRALRMAGTLSDISDLKAQECELVRARERAEAANKSKSEFLASMSHELRTPLNAVIGFAEVLEGELLGKLGDPRYQSYAADIRESGQHLLSLINDILDHAKIEAGRRDLHEEWLDVSQLIDATLRLVKERAMTREVKLSVDLPENLPRLYGDARGIKQILINLLTNAVKFTEAGGQVTVSGQVNEAGLLLTVADTGIGIAKDQMNRVMAPFGQANNSLSREHEGTGLGLALSHQLAGLHGGTLELDSEVNVGTTVRVRLPAERLEPSPGGGALQGTAKPAAASPADARPMSSDCATG